jgi:hypothetical protein
MVKSGCKKEIVFIKGFVFPAEPISSVFLSRRPLVILSLIPHRMPSRTQPKTHSFHRPLPSLPFPIIYIPAPTPSRANRYEQLVETMQYERKELDKLIEENAEYRELIAAAKAIRAPGGEISQVTQFYAIVFFKDFCLTRK